LTNPFFPERVLILKIIMNKYGFIPRHLEVPERPELSFFPLNILFISYARIDGIPKSGTALYEPIIETYFEDGDKLKMVYRNIYDQDLAIVWRILITFHKNKWIYTGVKCRNDKIMSLADGSAQDWNKFFGIWTAGGLSNLESCKFDTL